MTTSQLSFTAQDDEWGMPIETSTGVRCGNHHWKTYHENTVAVRACYAITQHMVDQQRAEVHAEAMMSWVMGGGDQAGAYRYAHAMATTGTWDGGISHEEFSGESCVHGLALELCADPVNHYPPDSYFD